MGIEYYNMTICQSHKFYYIVHNGARILHVSYHKMSFSVNIIFFWSIYIINLAYDWKKATLLFDPIFICFRASWHFLKTYL